MKQKKIFSFFILFFSLTLFADTSLDSSFDVFKNEFVETYWKHNPNSATINGYHKYDANLAIYNSEYFQQQKSFCNTSLQKMKSFDFNSLNHLNQLDYKIIENNLLKTLWEIDTLKEYEWNPALYNIGESFSYILSENYAPLNTRLATLNLYLDNVEEYYKVAKKNIKNPTNEHLALAIDQNEGTLNVIQNDFLDSIKKVNLPHKLESSYIKKATNASKAIHSYIDFLKSYNNPTPRNFRLGSELYAKKFIFDIQSEYSADKVYNLALERKNFLHSEMEKLSKVLWLKYFGNQTPPTDKLVLIKKVIDTISINHVKAESFRTEIEKQLPLLSDFVNKKNLLYLDPNKPLKVRKEPEYMAGVAGASMSSPGPYETNGTAYYNVGGFEGWSPEKIESYLREYNTYILQILNIHEAIPGHYVQLMYSNNAPSMIKKIFGNGTMIEGWAVYSEFMMMENGYGMNGQTDLEMWLMYYKWNLRATCNTLLDIGVHTKNMSKENAMDLLVTQGFQQSAEAENKWKRVTLTSVQLTSYFTGFHEILQLRKEYKQKNSKIYTLKEFNEKFLSFGSAPIKYIKQLMLK